MVKSLLNNKEMVLSLASDTRNQDNQQLRSSVGQKGPREVISLTIYSKYSQIIAENTSSEGFPPDT